MNEVFIKHVHAAPQIHHTLSMILFASTVRASLHSRHPAIIQADGLDLSIMCRKRSRVGSMLRCGCMLARMEEPTWSTITGVSPGTS
jgi:hypothetical protein